MSIEWKLMTPEDGVAKLEAAYAKLTEAHPELLGLPARKSPVFEWLYDHQELIFLAALVTGLFAAAVAIGIDYRGGNPWVWIGR